MRSISYLNRMSFENFRLVSYVKLFLSITLSLGIILGSPDLHAAFNQHEMKLMTENIEERFKLLIDTWNEELYFEMYDFGQRASQLQLSRGEFAQRMVELKWKPTLTPIQIEKIDILYLNYAVIYFSQEFENKVNLLRKVKKYMIFPVILENNIWKFNLKQLIRIPYEGEFEPPKIPTKKSKASLSKPPTTPAEAAEAAEAAPTPQNP